MIDSFSGEYRFLSNFWHAPIVLANGDVAATNEHAYQAAKALHADEYDMIMAADGPGKAKKLGRAIEIRPDWEAIKLGVMRDLIARKFTQDLSDPLTLADRLLGTGEQLLVEGNTWGDRIWGMVDGEGQNWLGHLLMAQRAILRGT